MRWGALHVLLACGLLQAAAFASQAETEFRQALRLHNANDLRAAAQTYRRALELDPTLVSAAINLAIIHEKWGESDTAEKLYDSAVRAAPNLFSSRYNRGQFLQKHGRLAEARADYQIALEQKPDEASLYINLAAIEIRLFEMTRDVALLSAAELRLKKAEALRSTSPALYFNRARLAELSNSPGLARTQYREAMRRYPNDSQEYRTCALRAERLSRQLR
ncbi:MAG TPA: tetratricopeptide repeat protein [Turneriella sp.]|nr:tetratricopeptide repeat protein [Turneriella sp.]